MSESKKYCIKFFDSTTKSDVYKEIYERLCETHLLDFYGPDKRVHITAGDDYTHVIIVNTAMPPIPPHIPKQNVIGLAFEPLPYLGLTKAFVNYAQKHIGTYYIGDKQGLPSCFTEQYAYMFHVTPLKSIPDKPKIISMIFSTKSNLDGHKYRHTLVKRILDDNLPIDIYGRGCRLYENYQMKHHSQLKGNFDNYEPYLDYQFHIAIENIQSNHYFSEKITNALLCGSIPVYLGCKNIESYFPEQSLVLTGRVETDITLIKNILREPEKYRKEINVPKVKQTIGLIQNIDVVFNNGNQ